MVAAPARLDRVLLEHAQARHGLAGVGDGHAAAGHHLPVSGRHGCDAAHVLHQVERGALRGQDIARAARDARDDLAGLGGVSLLHARGGLEHDRRVDQLKNARGDKQAADDPGFLGDKLALDMRLRSDGRGGGNIARADVLFQRELYDLVVQERFNHCLRPPCNVRRRSPCAHMRPAVRQCPSWPCSAPRCGAGSEAGGGTGCL